MGNFLSDFGNAILDKTEQISPALKNAAKQAKSFLGYGPQAQAPGPGAAIPPGPDGDAQRARLQRDELTGKYIDPVTGTVYNDPGGALVVADPSLRQQVAQNNQTKQALLGQLQASRAQGNQAFNGQTALADKLNNTITNPNAISVAQTQLGIGLDAAKSAQLSQAAGQSGQNSFLASRNAANNIAALQGQKNNAAALTRAQEVSDATKNLGTVLSQQGQYAQGQYKADMAGATDFANLSQNGENQAEGRATGINTANAETDRAFVHDGLQLGADIITGGVSGAAKKRAS